jgi:hypothetical protein
VGGGLLPSSGQASVAGLKPVQVRPLRGDGIPPASCSRSRLILVTLHRVADNLFAALQLKVMSTSAKCILSGRS